jgi:hypothetical protein
MNETTEIRGRIGSAETRLAGIEAEKAQLAYPATNGDSKAKARIKALNKERAEIEADISTMHDAVAEARRREKEAAKAEADATWAEAKEHAKAAIKAARHIEKLIADLAAARGDLERETGLAGRLGHKAGRRTIGSEGLLVCSIGGAMGVVRKEIGDMDSPIPREQPMSAIFERGWTMWMQGGDNA